MCAQSAIQMVMFNAAAAAVDAGWVTRQHVVRLLPPRFQHQQWLCRSLMQPYRWERSCACGTVAGFESSCADGLDSRPSCSVSSARACRCGMRWCCSDLSVCSRWCRGGLGALLTCLRCAFCVSRFTAVRA
jgi:hypothetical protein